MKSIFASLLLISALSASAQTAPSSLTLAWTNSDAAYGPACASPVTTKPCLSNSVASDITSLTPVIISGTPSTIGPAATSFTYSFPTTPSYGNHTYSLVATGVDANGNATTSAAATVVVDIEPKLNAPVITSAKVN